MIFSENHYFLVPLIFVFFLNLSRYQWSWGSCWRPRLSWFVSNGSETKAETNEIAAGCNKRKSSTDLNTDADDQSGKKTSKTEKKWLFRKRFLKFKNNSWIFSKSRKKDVWNLWKKCWLSRKKWWGGKRKTDLFYAVRKNILWKMN